ncbi:hypothetical protein Cfor_11822 [Coptotermes formosanus]|uniref:Multiple inositol polyphosphate phosphatase 1 n=1 Tax=Coptotermes formosanus TaxID=36987 RepID=A0A6L2PW89_COPFO|nr:hypothetical protein Cfor_11822 [Coptotermes formosanus]
MLLSIFWATIVGCMVAVTAEDSCYAHEHHPYVLFSTYTPYEFVHENSHDPVNIPHCQPLQFWIISRHGTRYNKQSGIEDMWSLKAVRDKIIDNIEQGRGILCADDVENLKKWTPQAASTLPNNLTPQGYKDAYYLAKRYKSRFPTLLAQQYDPKRFEVQFTDTQRTTLTAFAFIDGVFGSTVDVNFSQPVSADPLLKPSDYCTKWIQEVDDNPDSMKEANAFRDGPEVAEVITSVSKRLGFSSDIDYALVDIMYTTCRFEKAWHVYSISPWCAAFSKDDLKVLEYREDLESFYIRGFGNSMNKDVGCPLAKNFLDRFSELEEGKEQRDGVLYFSHDTDLQLFFTSLGVGKDEVNITHSNYASMADRHWRTSLLTPFASNFVATFFKCDEGEKFRVQFRLQEKVIKLSGCPDDAWGLCDWSVVKKNYGSISESCNLDKWCFW